MSIPAHLSNCPDCGEAIEYWRVHCRCGQFLGFPNFRAAAAEQDELEKRRWAAEEDARLRGTAALLTKLKDLAELSRPVIAMSFSACDDIMRPGKYRNYHQRIDSGEREPANPGDHADRAMVGARLFPTYGEHIHYAALSPHGRGLVSYGPVAVRWAVTPSYLGRRASLLEENSYTFYDRHALGRRSAAVPLGYRAIWEERASLVAAKLASGLTAATGESSLANLLLHAGGTRGDDGFVEIAIYADAGLDTRDVDMVTLQRTPTAPEEHLRWQLVRETCATRGVVLIE
jgi:hypothetical protein